MCAFIPFAHFIILFDSHNLIAIANRNNRSLSVVFFFIMRKVFLNINKFETLNVNIIQCSSVRALWIREFTVWNPFKGQNNLPTTGFCDYNHKPEAQTIINVMYSVNNICIIKTRLKTNLSRRNKQN